MLLLNNARNKWRAYCYEPRPTGFSLGDFDGGVYLGIAHLNLHSIKVSVTAGKAQPAFSF